MNEVHLSTVHIIAYTSDSSRVIACTADTGYIYSWKEVLLHSLIEHEEIIYSLVIAHQGTYTATGSEDHTARVWKIESGKELVNIQQHHEPVWLV